MSAHRITYHVLGTSRHTTSYAGTCVCGWSFVSPSSAVVTARGARHVLQAFDRERAA